MNFWSVGNQIWSSPDEDDSKKQKLDIFFIQKKNDKTTVKIDKYVILWNVHHHDYNIIDNKTAKTAKTEPEPATLTPALLYWETDWPFGAALELEPEGTTTVEAPVEEAPGVW